MIQFNNLQSFFQNEKLPTGQMVPSKVGNNSIDDLTLSKTESADIEEQLITLLKKVGIADTKANQQLLRLFLNEQLPISKESLKAASEWLKEMAKGDMPKALEAIKMTVQKELPLTGPILNSMLALQTEETITTNLAKVFEALISINPKTNTHQQLEALLRQLTEPSLHLENEKDITQLFKRTVEAIGLQYEHDISILEKEQTAENKLLALKPLLMKALEETSNPHARDKMDQLLTRITGLQLINSGQEGQFQQLLIHLPILLGNHSTDVRFKWIGKKQQNGQIDPDYCRVLFYLELEHLQEMLVDVHVQNRIVNIRIYNDNPKLNPVIKSVQQLLKDKLENLQYHLSSIIVSTKENENNKKPKTTEKLSTFSPSMNGVDIKI
ncbi:hypothetical protein [Schinkia azotoformans]|uniref:hypothetical protein n=1 Tax=Schinkia azotoformans TaxID=1454 RepID=UPI002DBE4D38|nr:hypothetical protein [Schinkia azotoformans]MEC1721843.1 hypothetical protein [Schinkia azotoformans]MED4411597.1 hypothetical protein [Schinkia azotoformans]